MEKNNQTNNNQEAPIQANFIQFLYGMAAQTQIQLGLIDNPLSGKSEPNLVQAKYSIDLLGILEEKTRGNLTEEEDEYLKKILDQLRICYVDIESKKS